MEYTSLRLGGNSLEMCCLLAIVMLFKRLSASLICVSIMSVAVLWYVLLSSSCVLQSVFLSSLLIIVMVPSLSASFITISLLEDRCSLICLEVISGVVRYARCKIVVVCSSAVYNFFIDFFRQDVSIPFPFHSVLLLLVKEQLSWFFVEKYSCKRRCLQNCSLS